MGEALPPGFLYVFSRIFAAEKSDMKRLFPVLFCLAAILVSCEKEVSEENGNTPSTPTTTTDDSIYISRIYELDTTAAAPNDSLLYVKYDYDNAKRPLRFEISNRIAGVWKVTFRTEHFYRGADTLPYKVVESDPGVQSDTIYYFYNAAGVVVRDSVIGVRSTGGSTITINDFIITPGKVDREITTYDYNTGALLDIDGQDYYTTYLNGNLVRQVDTVPASGNLNDYKFAYDNGINPLYRFSIRYPISPPEHLFYENPQGVNNFTRIDQDENGGAVFYKYNVAYRYKANGQPVKAIAFDAGGATPVYDGTLHYYYVK